MRVAKLIEPKKIEISNEELNKNLKENEVLIRIKTAGICGTDLHLFNGERSGLTFPRIMGHEIAGEVEAVGSEVESFNIGDRVVVDPVVSCGECYACSMGRHNICNSVSCIGVQVDGGFRDYFKSPENRVYKIPESISWEEAALIETFSVAAQAIDKGDVKEGDNVVVIGAGAIGLCILEICKLLGANVLVSDMVESRLKKAKELGADMTVNVQTESIKNAVDELTGNIGAEIVIDAVGHPKLFEEAITLTAQGARVVILGFHDEPAQIPEAVITKNELEIKGARMNLDKFPKIIEWFNDKKLNPKSFISAEYSFEDIQKGFEDILENPNAFIKVVLKF